MVTNMSSIRGRRPAKRYFASANPPRLLSVTTSTVWSDERNSELSIHRANGSRVNRTRKLSSVRSPSRPQGRKAVVKMSFCGLNAAHASQRKGRRMRRAETSRVRWRRREETR
jgi:hypothetical protein